MEDFRNGRHISPSSSPPTPPSPLPISVGPGNQPYSFSPSPSPSPPFSAHTSAENLPLLPEKLEAASATAQVPSAFSLDLPRPDQEFDSKSSSCLQDLVEWFVEKCCKCCSTSL
ncbi:hypothetical protein M5689_018304 [Euphorbia peplus]|nr:hypothetical protein M5689_018304 [Euphorbia peplus]